MAIAFQCHKCGGKFAAPDHLAGQQARCQRCSTVVNVPLASAVPVSPLRQPQPSLVSNVPWTAILAGGGLLLFLGFGALCLFVFVQIVWPKLQTLADRTTVPAVSPQPPVTPQPTPNVPTAKVPTSTPNPFETTPSSASPTPATPNSSAPGSGRPSGSGDAPGLPNLPTSSGPRPAAGNNSAPALPPTSWSARPDPPLAPVEYKKGKIAIPLPSNAELRLPYGPSHFILGFARDFQKEIWEVIDLRTGKGIGKPIQAKLDIDYRSEAFSPDGRYLAALQRRSGDEIPIGVWSFISGQMERVLRVKGWRVSAPLRFGAAHQLVSLHEQEHNLSVLTLWNLQTGDKVREIGFPAGSGENRLQPESLAVSPGGKYATLVMGNQLGVFDLTTGQPAGNAVLPVVPSSCEGTAFSPDGRELALVVGSGSGHRLFIVDFSSGRIDVDQDYRGNLRFFFYDGPVLDWLPDKSGLIWRGHILLERTSGEEVWYFDTTDGNPRRFIRDNELLVLVRDRGQKLLRTFDLPEKEIDKAMLAVREGGVAIDAALPPLTTPDTFGVTQQTLPNGRTAWSLSPDAAGPTPRGQERELLVAKSGENVRGVMFAGTSAGKVVVQKEITPPAGPGFRPARQVVIERYDLTSGERGQSLEVPHVYQLADVSPSGRFAVVAFAPEANKYDRLDILGLAPKKHVAAWRPYGGEKEQPAAAGNNQQARFPSLWGLPSDPRSIAWISMLDDEHLLTVNTTGKLVCWKLPECKALYAFADFGEPLAVSAGRKYLAGGHSGEFRVFEALTGKCVGDLDSPLSGSRAIRGAFRPDGQELVAVIDAGTDKMLVRWDMKNGKLTQEVPIPAVAVSSYVPFYAAHNGVRLGMEYRGNNFLMIDDQFLVDLSKRALVWRYHLPQGHFAANSPDDRTWYCIRKNNVADQSMFLTSIDTPSNSVLNKSQGKSLEKQLVLYPGMSVRVAVDLSAAGMSDLTPTVAKAVAQGLEARGLVIDPAAPLVFSVVAAQRATGEQIQVYSGSSPFGYNPFFNPGQPSQTISQEELAVRLSVSDAGGKVLWHMDRSARMRAFGSVRSGDAGTQLRDEMVKQFESVLAGSGSATQSLPRYIFGDLDSILAGESQLGFHDESPPPQSQLPAARQPPGIAPGS